MAAQPIFALAPFLGPKPQSAIGGAFAHLAQRLDPDATPEGQAVVLQIEYDAIGDEPPQLGARYVLVVPRKAPSAELWYERVVKPFLQRPSPVADPRDASS